MDRKKYTKPYKCIKDFVFPSDTQKRFTRGLVYNSYHKKATKYQPALTCFINNQNNYHNLIDDDFVEYFADVNYPLELS